MTFKSDKEIAGELGSKIAGEVMVDVYTRVAYSTDASIYQIKPMCVVSVRDGADVAAVVEYAANNGIAIAARGAGSGLAGESLTEGIVIDTTTHMKRIVGVSGDHGLVTVQPGVVMDDLNNYLAEFGKKIGPVPSSSNRATAGGCIANNATGAHSLVYGYLSNFVESLDVVLADGTAVTVSNDVDPEDASVDPAVAKLAKRCFDLLNPAKDLIDKCKPTTKRNHSGYNIDGVCHDGRVDLARLIAGSEGTLCVITQAVLRTVDIPKVKALVQFEFKTFEKMAAAVPIIVDCGASACELMDRTLMAVAAEALPEYYDLFPSECAAVLMVEQTGESEEEVKEKIAKTIGAVGGLSSEQAEYFDADAQARLWKSRKDAVPLLGRQRGAAKPVAFIEDISVDHRRLGEYIAGLEAISEKHHVEMAFYGHAGDGELHIRPYLDLSSREGLAKMNKLAEEVFTLAFSLGGSASGEHADGLVRAAFIKQQFGGEYYEVLKQVKKIFDADGIMNPGKIINDDPEVMTKQLRAAHLVFAERLMPNLNFDPNDLRYRIEQCNGDGVCLSTQSDGRMCPVFRAVGTELASSRAKANLLRGWITGALSKEDFESDQFKKILELCINCKMCSVECPSGVDISSLIIESRAEVALSKGLSKTETLLCHSHLMSKMGSAFAPLSNLLLGMKLFRVVLEKMTGLDSRRVSPKFQRSSFVKKANRYLAKEGPIENSCDKVAYFVDSYANYNDHELGFAVVKFLRYCGIEVIVPKQQVPVPLPAMVYGDVKMARKELGFIVEHLAETIRSGYKIVCSEPSAALCLVEEAKLFVDNEDAAMVAANTYELSGYLNTFNKIGRLTLDSRKGAESFYYDVDFAYHAPCHLKVLGGGADTVEFLRLFTDVRVADVNSGCCGLAGTCGMQKKNYDLSLAIAKEAVGPINNSRADLVMTECAACKMQIEHLTGKKVMHPVKVLAKIYGLL